MEKFNVIVKSYDDEDYREIITKEPVNYSMAVGIDRQISMSIDENEFYTVIEKI